jgi:hypothetical protein
MVALDVAGVLRWLDSVAGLGAEQRAAVAVAVAAEEFDGPVRRASGAGCWERFV